VAQTFFVDEDVQRNARLDAVVTVADAKWLSDRLKDAPEAKNQIAFADVILLNKTDLVATADLTRVEERIRRMNSLAKIHRTQRAQIDVGKILNIKARDLNAPLAMPAAGEPDEAAHHHNGNQHDDEGEHNGHAHEDENGSHGQAEHSHYHDEKVRSFSIVEDRPLDLKKTETWISELVSSMGENIYRCKGILFIQGQPKRVVFQGVQMMFDATPDRFWKPDENRQSRMVFIGKELDEAKIRAGFVSCLAP